MKGCDKLIDTTKVTVDENYLYFQSDKTPTTKKKISGHSFVNLADLNPFSKRGDTILSLLGIKKDDFDSKYMLRGEVAESLVRSIYENKLHKKITWYDEQTKKKNNYDLFPKYLQCGGIPDIELFEENTLIEVKSKSMKDYDKIKQSGALAYELYQGLYYGYLRNFSKITMFYVFFDEETEQEIYENKPVKTFNNIKFLKQEYDVNRDEIDFLLRSVLNYYNTCIKEKRIPIEDISNQVKQEIGVANNAL